MVRTSKVEFDVIVRNDCVIRIFIHVDHFVLGFRLRLNMEEMSKRRYRWLQVISIYRDRVLGSYVIRVGLGLLYTHNTQIFHS